MQTDKSEFVHGTGLKYDDLFNPSTYFSNGYFDCNKLEDAETLSFGHDWYYDECLSNDDPRLLVRAILRIIRHGASNRTIGRGMADASVPEIADLQLAIYDLLTRVQAEGAAENDDEATDAIAISKSYHRIPMSDGYELVVGGIDVKAADPGPDDIAFFKALAEAKKHDRAARMDWVIDPFFGGFRR